MNINGHENTITLQDRLRALWRVVRTAALIAILPLVLLYIFGFSVKTSKEYDCVMQTISQSRQVIAVTGEPLTPGLFAWITYFESGGGLRQGHFFTAVSGPRGRGRIEASFYRTPLGATLGIRFKTGGEEIDVYHGEYPCP